MPYYGQSQTYGSNAQRQSPHQQQQQQQHQAAIAAALVAAAAMSNGAQASIPGSGPSNSMSTPVNNSAPVQNEGSFPVDSGTASSPSAAGDYVKSGTVTQPVYRGNGVCDWWPTVAAS
ncbi:hypothetical protein FBUS_09473 [Fasciolopsis buskii]|nr:hypothetical protein FBUS_09473 [Fasciolopsis buski]